ncbi:hypothetical protein ACFFGT_02745 [Mucilaginibacter angelicae]|uniref:2,6-dihydroxypyridine 3-monooxygenase substrate binding domain-containing protein n=1 Tax=Mucilaginibacter angelicae TaxID=869718 RepID=A0ABV6L057_9SPHI
MLKMTDQSLHIGIIGGSLGGLVTGIALQEAGHHVSIYEKSKGELEDRGAGIVLQDELINFFNKYHIASIKDISVPIFKRTYINKEGNKIYEQDVIQLMTAWGTIYHRLQKRFPKEHYYYEHKLKSFYQDKGRVTVEFENGKNENFDLLIGADGTNSTVRNELFPEIHHVYAGYVGWRGVVPEAELDSRVLREFQDRFTFYNMDHSHILCYLIPGNQDEVSVGNRRLNWVWYWNVKPGEEIDSLLTDINGNLRNSFVPEGYVRPQFIDQQTAIAEMVLPPIFQSLWTATKNPFLQPINDLSVKKMYQGRVALVGDSAFTPRPHTAASTAKAVSNGISLAHFLKINGNDIEAALRQWEEPQLSLGNYLYKRGVTLGDQSQFGY